MTVAVAGLWHLGTVTAACLAGSGQNVIGWDENAETIQGLQIGRAPIFEPGLDELLRKGRETGKLQFSCDPKTLGNAELVWITYDTPVDENDQADVEAVIRRAAALFPHLRIGALMLISSQLPVGSTRRLEQLYKKSCPSGTVTFACSPENLRLGKAIDAFTKPERIVVGVRSNADKARLEPLLKVYTERIEWVSVESAEMTKHALNAFLATSVTFINELATLCERVGADAREVERGLKSDIRIGARAYLRAGPSFAGGTLARDVAYLMDIGEREGLPAHLFSAVKLSNDAHKEWPLRRLKELSEGNLQGQRVTVLGLTYKPGTDTLRRSSAVETCRWLHTQGVKVQAYDPAVKSLPDELQAVIQLCVSVDDALRDSMAMLVATEWPEFAALKADTVVKSMRQATVLDPGGFLIKELGADARVRYLTVGRS